MVKYNIELNDLIIIINVVHIIYVPLYIIFKLTKNLFILEISYYLSFISIACGVYH